ncbi:MAG: 3'-5' exonuclease [Thermodesulfovibrionales bacterium]
MIGTLSLIDNFFADRRTSKAALSRPVQEAAYTVLDTELTGLDLKKDSIVSIGALRMTGTRIELGETFYSLVKPETMLRSQSVVVHGIMPSEVDEKPGIGEALDRLYEFIGDSVIVGHFISLDMGFINKYLKQYQKRTSDNLVVDTCRLHEWLSAEDKGFGRHYDGQQESKDLVTIARKHGIGISGSHNALMDSYITAQLFQRFMVMLVKRGVLTLRDLLRIGKP